MQNIAARAISAVQSADLESPPICERLTSRRDEIPISNLWGNKAGIAGEIE
jgi:hypothetical protein